MHNIDHLTEEIFCLNYELNTLSNVLLRRKSERWVPGFLYESTECSHTDRYKLACNYTAGKKVIDIACGVGKGSYMMATDGDASMVDGFDIDADAIRYAGWRNHHDKVSFALNDAENLNIVNTYDIAVSFETVEHLPDYRKFFEGIKQCLKPGGLFLISTPISPLEIDDSPENPYHVQEWGFYAFQNAVKEFFDIEQVYIQLYPKYEAPPAPVRHGLMKRVLNRLKHEMGYKPPVAAQINNTRQSNGDNFSKIECYAGQYPVSDFGNSRLGYQIVVAKVKDV